MTFHVIAPDHLPCRTTARQCVGLIAIHAIGVHGVRDEVDAALAAMVSQQADAVYVEGTLPRKLTIDLALEHRLPAAGVSPFAREGGLISYSVTGKWPPTQSKDAFSLSSGCGSGHPERLVTFKVGTRQAHVLQRSVAERHQFRPRTQPPLPLAHGAQKPGGSISRTTQDRCCHGTLPLCR